VKNAPALLKAEVLLPSEVEVLLLVFLIWVVPSVPLFQEFVLFWELHSHMPE
jgi:hypothetical protein